MDYCHISLSSTYHSFFIQNQLEDVCSSQNPNTFILCFFFFFFFFVLIILLNKFNLTSLELSSKIAYLLVIVVFNELLALAPHH